MSLCLAPLLAAIAIDWWNGWQPSPIHSKCRGNHGSNEFQPLTAIDLIPPTDRRRARAAELPPRRLSPTAGDAASDTRARPPFRTAPRCACSSQMAS
jgi:hypothetical protein